MEWRCLSTCGSNAETAALTQVLLPVGLESILPLCRTGLSESVASGIALLCDEYTLRVRLSAVLCSTSPCPQPPKITDSTHNKFLFRVE